MSTLKELRQRDYKLIEQHVGDPVPQLEALRYGYHRADGLGMFVLLAEAETRYFYTTPFSRTEGGVWETRGVHPRFETYYWIEKSVREHHQIVISPPERTPAVWPCVPENKRPPSKKVNI